MNRVSNSLSMTTVDVGEENTRNVCSGLVKHVPVEEMQVHVRGEECSQQTC